jgi:hypothetical protein
MLNALITAILAATLSPPSAQERMFPQAWPHIKPCL